MHANHRGLLQTHPLDARRGVRCRRVEPRASLVTRSLSLLTQVAQRLGWRAFSLNPRCSCFLCSFPSRDTEHLSQMFSFSALFRLLVPAQSGGTLWKKKPALASATTIASLWKGPRLVSCLQGPEGTTWRATGCVSQATGVAAKPGALSLPPSSLRPCSGWVCGASLSQCPVALEPLCWGQPSRPLSPGFLLWGPNLSSPVSHPTS